MAGLIQAVKDWHNYFFEELPDPVTKNWFLAGSPYKIICILIVYVYFSTRLGPWFMRNRKPYNIKNVMHVFNIFQIATSWYLFYQAILYIFSKEFNFMCQNVDDTRTPRGLWAAEHTWFYFIIKLTDLLDTVFFVLRKSFRQISSLHLHHHTLMPFVSWIGVTYFPGGQAAILGCLNTFVHAIMYTYYYIAGLGDEYKKYLWWKRHVTELQLAQFILVGLHSANSLFYECGYPTTVKLLKILYAGIFINMFGQFYYVNYIANKSKEKRNDVRDKLVKDNYKNGNETTDESNGSTVKNIHNIRNGKDQDTKTESDNRFEKHLKNQ